MKRKNNCSDFCLFQTGRNFLWKKFSFLLMCAFLGSLPTTAQTRKVGDPIVKDGVPCVIIQVYDEAGNHGLAMSLTPTRKALKAAKKTGDMKWFYSPKKLKGSDKELQQEYLTEYYNYMKCDSLKIQTSGVSTTTQPSTSHSGKENMKNVIDYCNEKGIEMEMYFPEYAWAQSLGEGWFIPGVDELELYIKLWGYEEFGKKMPLKNFNKTIIKDFKKAITTLLGDSGDAIYFKDGALPGINFISSTIAKTKNVSPAILLAVTLHMQNYCVAVSQSFFNWLQVKSRGTLPNPHICAVCEF